METSQPVKPPQPKVHPLEPWRDVPMTCVHCGKVLRNYAAKNSHLQFCKKRILKRFFKVRNLLFILQWNPLKKRSSALHRLIVEYDDPKMVVGVLKYLNYVGMLHSFDVVELSKSPEMVKYPNGWVQYPIIKQKLEPSEFVAFETNVQGLEALKKQNGVKKDV